MFALFGLALAAMQIAQPPTVSVGWDGKHCETIVEGAVIEQDALITRVEKWVRDGRSASVRAGIDVPYRCIGAVIYNLQRAGVTKIGFFSEPEANQASR